MLPRHILYSIFVFCKGDMEMSANTRGAGVFLELRKRLQSGLLIIGKDVAANPTGIVVTGQDSSLHIRTTTGEVTFLLPPGVSYVKESYVLVSGRESCEEELHFRLRITASHIKTEESSDIVRALRAQETYCFYCQSCMTRLLEDRLFTRVLPLPNGNWNTIVDDWCCHPDPFANKKMLPRAADCLLGDTFFLLTRDDSCKQTLLQEVSTTDSQDSKDPKKTCRRLELVSCMSCSSVLGEALTPETLRLYVTQVVVEPSVGDRMPESSVSRSFFLESTIAARLAALSNSMSSFHFSVQTPSGKPFLLLWLLNSDSIMASVPGWSDCTVTHHSPSVRAAKAIKLLYIDCSHMGVQQQAVATSWEVNATGHAVVFPLKVCEELLQVIEDSSATLPYSMRHMKAYKLLLRKLKLSLCFSICKKI
ncbi:E3 ubiquitin-protein ligase E3D isoform X1 [Corythoichthys intestinalis]|uniref:E3 ubiquitin-protein ligase E3D isoform X1 n=1 Tax=Corythoichthys intestinalis TaxID=161448 RepID=UPI0025A4EA94|nr:E3 ubiquitin-protein ligase E3D isoform X1 [Corythoichthys intestinalis]